MAVEHLFIVLKKFWEHSLQILNRKSEQLSAIMSLRSELTLHFVHPLHPVDSVIVHLLILDIWLYNINYSKGVASVDGAVSKVRMLGEYVAAVSLLKEINVLNIVTFEVDVFVLVYHKTFEQGTDPRNERLRFVI